jgi:hypothetical protein
MAILYWVTTPPQMMVARSFNNIPKTLRFTRKGKCVERYFFDMVGVDRDDMGFEYSTPGEARNSAISYLGEYLRDFPEYARQGHWQVDVFDKDRNLIFNVVVATVDVRAVGSVA